MKETDLWALFLKHTAMPYLQHRYRGCMHLHSKWAGSVSSLGAPLVTQWNSHEESFVLSALEQKGSLVPWRNERMDSDVWEGVGPFFDSFLNSPFPWLSFHLRKSKGEVVLQPPQRQPSTDIPPAQVRSFLCKLKTCSSFVNWRHVPPPPTQCVFYLRIFFRLSFPNKTKLSPSVFLLWLHKLKIAE